MDDEPDSTASTTSSIHLSLAFIRIKTLQINGASGDGPNTGYRYVFPQGGLPARKGAGGIQGTGRYDHQRDGLDQNPMLILYLTSCKQNNDAEAATMNHRDHHRVVMLTLFCATSLGIREISHL
jgi:hypothetical protein